MVTFGMNLLLWTGEVRDEHLPVLEMLKDLGFDGVEVPVMAMDEATCSRLGERLAQLGLAATACAVRNAEENPISPDAAVRRAGTEANLRAVDCAQALGAKLLSGPFHSAIGVFTGKGPTEQEWAWGAESMRTVAEHAEQANITLGLEYLNRFECYFLTSTAETLRFLRDVDHPRCRIMLDTFHANIEEKDLGQAIRDCGADLVHMQLAENDRGTPGHGHVPWDDVFAALKDVGYAGWLSAEAFGLSLPELAAATKIWRRMYDSEEQLCRDALAFMKARWNS